MKELIDNQFVVLLVGGLLGGMLKYLFDLLKAKMDYRFDTFSELQKDRFEAYKKLWAISKIIPRWPRREHVTSAELENTSVLLRDWYYDTGGILLTERTKEKFLKIQAELNRYIAESENGGTLEIDHTIYDHLHKVFSELRTELTIDLMSRERYKS